MKDWGWDYCNEAKRICDEQDSHDPLYSSARGFYCHNCDRIKAEIADGAVRVQPAPAPSPTEPHEFECVVAQKVRDTLPDGLTCVERDHSCRHCSQPRSAHKESQK